MEDASEVAAPERLNVPLNWADVMATTVQHANQALGQLGTPVRSIPDGILLILGSVDPPVIPDENIRDAVINDLLANGAKVSVLGRFHLSRETAEEVIRILREATAQYDAAVKQAAEAGSGAAKLAEEGQRR